MPWYVACGPTWAEGPIDAVDIEAVRAMHPHGDLVIGPIDACEHAEAVVSLCQATLRGEAPGALEVDTYPITWFPPAPLALSDATRAAPGPRNRKERRAAAKLTRKLRAAPRRLIHEHRFTQGAEFAERRVSTWKDLDEDDREDLLEQADQSGDRW